MATEQNWIPVGDMSERKRESDGKIARSYIHPRTVVGGGSTLTPTIVAYAPSYSYSYEHIHSQTHTHNHTYIQNAAAISSTAISRVFVLAHSPRYGFSLIWEHQGGFQPRGFAPCGFEPYGFKPCRKECLARDDVALEIRGVGHLLARIPFGHHQGPSARDLPRAGRAWRAPRPKGLGPAGSSHS